MLNFGQKVEEKSGDIIPKDALLWAVINIRKINNSKETNGRYLDIELTIADGIPYARRKIWEMIADPFDTNNSEEWRAMGYGAIRRILEAVKGAVPDRAESYALNRLEDLHGLMVPIITKVEKGKDGYDDKNKAEFLSPYSSVKKISEGFRLLQTGIYTCAKETKAPSVPGQGSMFTGTAAQPPAQLNHQPPAGVTSPAANNAPGWLAPAVSTQQTPPAQPVVNQPVMAPPQQTFTQGQAPAPQAAPNSGAFAAPANQASLQAPAVNATSPSNGWQAPQAGAPAQFPGQ